MLKKDDYNILNLIYLANFWPLYIKNIIEDDSDTLWK